MRFIVSLCFLLLASLTPLHAAPSASASASGEITVENARAHPTIAGRPGVGYLKLINTSDTPRLLVSADSPAIGNIEIHNHVIDDGVARMRRIENVSIPAHGMVHFKPHGPHLMVFNPAKPLQLGDHFPVTLNFDNADSLSVTINVENRHNPHAAGHHHP